MYKLLVLAALLALCASKRVRFRNCKSAFEVHELDIDPCPGPTNAYCPMIRGTSPQMRLTFTPKWRVENMTTVVQARVGSLIVPYPVEETDVCASANITCPLEPDRVYTYTTSVPIKSVFPKLKKIFVNWILNDPTNDADPTVERKREVCFIFRVKVVDPQDVEAK